jgi:excinuclease ABC subunit C
MKFPPLPGVYLFKDRQGRVIYVGKAKSLKDRIYSYFQPSDSPKTAALLKAYKTIDFIVTPTELEALLLERKLILKFKPQFNVSWRDDKQYPYLKLTLNEEWPRLIIARKREEDGARYFGPFESRSVKETIRLIKRLFPVRWCKESPLKMRQQPCLQYHLKHCWAPCVGGISPEEYLNWCRAISSLLEGDFDSALQLLRKEMEKAAEQQRFEEAGKLRDRIRNLSRLLQKRPGWMPQRGEREGETGIFELKRELGLKRLPRRIEAFDVSNLQGSNTVASLVTFKEGEPLKSDYRKFKIQLKKTPNDVAALQEAVRRRYTGSLKGKMSNPDLVLVDGGITQARAARRALHSAGLTTIVIGLAKKKEEIYFPEKNLPVCLPADSSALRLLKQIRDESHRFALAYQRSRRTL